MSGLPAGVPIYLCTQPVDFRKGFDGLTGIVTTAMNHSVTDNVELAMWIAGVSLKSAKNRRKRMAA